MIWCILFQLIFSGPIVCDWFTDYDKAMTHAQEHNKNVLMVFAGSDWCRPCIRFKETILTSDDFQAFAKENVDILYLNFPAKKKNKLTEEQTRHNEQLAEKYNQSGIFPRIFLLMNNGEVIKELKFSDQSSSKFIQELSQG